MLTEALCQRIEVRGFQDVTLRLTDEALSNGFGAVLPERFGVSVSGRGERASPSLTQQPSHFLMINRTRNEDTDEWLAAVRRLA